MRAGIALGSNLGDRLALLRSARLAILALPGIDPAATLTAPLFQTAPVDCPPGSGPFLNSVMEVGYAGEPLDLLHALRGIEIATGRPAVRGVNVPRPLDLDILYADGWVLQTAELTLPHPRMLRRRFVLAPLSRIRPGLVLPGQRATVAAILEQLDDDPATVALAAEQW